MYTAKGLRFRRDGLFARFLRLRQSAEMVNARWGYLRIRDDASFLPDWIKRSGFLFRSASGPVSKANSFRP
jgi:hypothetical protein